VSGTISHHLWDHHIDLFVMSKVNVHDFYESMSTSTVDVTSRPPTDSFLV